MLLFSMGFDAVTAAAVPLFLFVGALDASLLRSYVFLFLFSQH
jgi:hypothetical protein